MHRRQRRGVAALRLLVVLGLLCPVGASAQLQGGSGGLGGGGGDGDAYNTISDGVNTCSAVGSTTLEAPGATLTCGNPTIVVVSRTLVHYACDDVVTTALTYMGAVINTTSTNCTAADSTPNSPQRALMPSAFTVRKLSCLGAPAASTTWTFTVRVAGVNGAVTCPIANPSTSCASAAGLTQTGTAGQGVSVELADNTANDGGAARCVVELSLQ